MSREDEYDFLFKGIVAPFWRSTVCRHVAFWQLVLMLV